MMDMVVCVKQVPNPQAPPSSFRIDSQANRVIPGPGAPVVNGFDEQAVEAALRIKNTHGGKITVIALGGDLVPDVITKPLSMGADEFVIVWDDRFEGGDSYSTAQALAAAIKKIGRYDLIFCGRQAADTDAGQVGSGIAEILGIPCITFAKGVNAADGRVRVERTLLSGYEVVEAPTPCLITVSNELGQPRYPTVRGILAARRKQPTRWNAQDLGIDPARVGAAGACTKRVRLFTSQKVSRCEIVAADSAAEAGEKLALKLREAKII